ncbi:conserved hypothetical protein [Ricinus communis]|uniref:Uncharacterized protein n=1 Tax=Ricinus communis TaxID=3988 RepID=B9RW44_RICCO|nr:conserved hypothetical protein [Ricinus communis]
MEKNVPGGPKSQPALRAFDSSVVSYPRTSMLRSGFILMSNDYGHAAHDICFLSIASATIQSSISFIHVMHFKPLILSKYKQTRRYSISERQNSVKNEQ